MKTKLIVVLAILFVSGNLLAKSIEKEVYKEELNFRSSIHSEIKVNEHRRVFIAVYKKRPRRGAISCKSYSRSRSSRNCRVTVQKVKLDNLVLNRDNQIIYKTDTSVINCGKLVDKWYGTSPELNDRCRLVSYESKETKDDGIDIYNVNYGIVKFVAEN